MKKLSVLLTVLTLTAVSGLALTGCGSSSAGGLPILSEK